MTQFEDKNATILVEATPVSQQIILNGQVVNQECTICSGLCSHCNAQLITGQPGATVGEFMSYLESLRQANSLGYCPSCGFKLNLYETITIPVTNQEEVKTDE